MKRVMSQCGLNLASERAETTRNTKVVDDTIVAEITSTERSRKRSDETIRDYATTATEIFTAEIAKQDLACEN